MLAGKSPSEASYINFDRLNFAFNNFFPSRSLTFATFNIVKRKKSLLEISSPPRSSDRAWHIHVRDDASYIRSQRARFEFSTSGSWPSVTVILMAHADKDVSNPPRGRKFKVAWRAANARTAVPYFKITKKAAKQTIPLRHRHPRSLTTPVAPYRPLGLERKDKKCTRLEGKI